jgi:hypothetical protein
MFKFDLNSTCVDCFTWCFQLTIDASVFSAQSKRILPRRFRGIWNPVREIYGKPTCSARTQCSGR